MLIQGSKEKNAKQTALKLVKEVRLFFAEEMKKSCQINRKFRRKGECNYEAMPFR